MAEPAEDPGPTYNVNVGVLGHVDSGKTSLVAALSTQLSTAALDKHPQSRERGITLDLGFSSFTVPAPPAFREAGYSRVQFTLVDCPGHASLIRTIIGGAQIIDLMVLVVDATKGIQTQTAECIVIGEVTTDIMVVALNKTDQLPSGKRDKYISKATKLVHQTLASTKFAGSPVIPVSARPAASGEAESAPVGIQDLVSCLLASSRLRPVDEERPFLFYIDHCFAIRGQGTVLTGTVGQGSLRVNDTIELPELKLQRRVKGMQAFRKPVAACHRGDRVGICVTQLDSKLIERGLACAPGSVPTFSTAIAAVEKIRFFPGTVASNAKLHVTVGHTTVMAELLFFGLPDEEGVSPAEALAGLASRLSLADPQAAGSFDSGRDYQYQEELYGLEGRPIEPPHWDANRSSAGLASGSGGGPVDSAGRALHYGPQWALLRFAAPVTAPADSLAIGARLDADLHASTCRLALHGRLCLLPPANAPLHGLLRVYKRKGREGALERVEPDGCTAVCRGMFKKESDLTAFQGMAVIGPAGQAGTLQGSFGKSGKFKVHFPSGVALQPGQPNRVVLSFKRYLFDPDKRHMAQ